MDTIRQDSFRFGRKRKEVIMNTYRMEPKITPRQIYPTIYKKLRRIVSSLAKECPRSLCPTMFKSALDPSGRFVRGEAVYGQTIFVRHVKAILFSSRSSVNGIRYMFKYP